MVRAVFDTTIFVSALLTPSGLAKALVERAGAGEFTLILSQEIVDEYFSTLRTHKRLRKDYGYSDEEVAYFMSIVRRVATFVADLPLLQVVRDPKDDVILATAVKADADYLVTRDKDLLTIAAYQNTGIITPEDFLRILIAQQQDGQSTS